MARTGSAPRECRLRRGGNWKDAEPQLEPAHKVLRAIDIDSGKVTWEIPQQGSVYPKTWPGVMATAGGLVFYGDPAEGASAGSIAEDRAGNGACAGVGRNKHADRR